MVKEYLVYLAYSEESHVYLGLTKDPTTRWRSHLTGSSNNSLRELIAGGVHFEFEILEAELDLEEAQTLELTLIHLYTELYGDKVLNKARHKTTMVSHLIDKEKHLKTLLTFGQVNTIRDYWNNSEGTVCQTTLAMQYGVSLPTMHNIIHNKRWRDDKYTPCLSKKMGAGKLRVDIVPHVRQNYQDLDLPRPTYKSYAEKYGITGVAMGLVLRGKSYKSLGGPILGKDY